MQQEAKYRQEAVSAFGVSKIYMLDEVKVKALNGVTLEIKQGEFVALVGPSGSGKTTLMNLIGLLDTPTSGEIWLEGREVSELSRKQKQRQRLNDIGFVFQEFNLIRSLTAAENVQLPLMFAGIPNEEQKTRSTELLEQVGLSKREHHLPSQLSGGERQRVAIARAMANRPKLILADEPTGNLDTKTAQEVFTLFKTVMGKQRTIIAGTHNPELAKLADRIIFIRDGKIEADQT